MSPDDGVVSVGEIRHSGSERGSLSVFLCAFTWICMRSFTLLCTYPTSVLYLFKMGVYKPLINPSSRDL